MGSSKTKKGKSTISKEKTSVDISGNIYAVKEYEYDKFNNVTKVKDFGTGSTAAVTISEYDKLSRKTAEYTPNFSADNSHGTLTTYYPSGAVKTQTDALGNVTSFTYDAYGKTIEKTNPDGTVNGAEYDGLQREKATYFRVSEGYPKQILTSTEYKFESGKLRTIKTTYITAEKQVVTETLADFRGNTVQEKTNGEIKRTSVYYANGQLKSQTDALGNTTKYEYNYLNKLTKTIAPFDERNAETVNEYDKNGNVIKVIQNIDDGKKSITRNQYNAMGLLEKVTLSDGTLNGGKNITKYFYNNAGIQTKMYTGMSSESDTSYLTTNYEYDSWLRAVRTTDSTGYNSGTITYDLNGNVLTNTDANGNVTTNTYDALNRVLTANTVNPNDSSKNVSKSYQYDKMGRTVRTTVNDKSTTYLYDDLGRVYQEEGYNSFKGYKYAGISQYPIYECSGIFHKIIYYEKDYEYDDEMRVSSVQQNENDIVSYTYDANGNKKSETLGNGVISTYTYNKANRITKIENKKGNSNISVYEYSYYLDGSDACKTRNENGIIEKTEYKYDGLKRLTEESVKVGNSTDTYAYEYDDYGNRSKMTATGSENYVTEYSYNNAQGKYTALLQKETKTVEDDNALKLQNNVKQTVYTYDANGNQLTKTADGKTETNTYDGLNQLIGFTDGETTASYTYGISGLRDSKTVNGVTTTHIWSGSQIVVDYTAHYTSTVYIRGTSLAAAFDWDEGSKGDNRFYIQNAHGDVVNLTNTDGEVTKKYTYDAFGVEKNIDDSDTNAFRYCGEYYDAETGTIYLRARYYNPGTGRFISRDSFAGRRSDPLSLNLYTYCRNNPIRYIDPSGHDAVEAAAFKYNNPRPTHINSAWDAKQLQKWDNKFNDLLNSAPKINSQYDVTLYNNLRNKFTAPPSFKVNSNSDANYYKQRMDMYKTWKSIVGQAPLTKSGVSWKVPGSVVLKNESMIEELQPKMKPLVRSFLINANESGYPLFVSWGLRTNDDEAQFSDGVQNGKHTQGLAVDVEFWDDVYKDVWPGDPMEFHWKICDYGIYSDNDPRWNKIGPIGENVGLLWGNSFGDNPHFYLPK